MPPINLICYLRFSSSVLPTRYFLTYYFPIFKPWLSPSSALVIVVKTSDPVFLIQLLSSQIKRLKLTIEGIQKYYR